MVVLEKSFLYDGNDDNLPDWVTELMDVGLPRKHWFTFHPEWGFCVVEDYTHVGDPEPTHLSISPGYVVSLYPDGRIEINVSGRKEWTRRDDICNECQKRLKEDEKFYNSHLSIGIKYCEKCARIRLPGLFVERDEENELPNDCERCGDPCEGDSLLILSNGESVCNKCYRQTVQGVRESKLENGAIKEDTLQDILSKRICAKCNKLVTTETGGIWLGEIICHDCWGERKVANKTKEESKREPIIAFKDDAHARVNILGTIYTITNKSREEIDKSKECDGQMNNATKEIYIDETAAGDYRKFLLRHEIIHAIMRECGVFEWDEELFVDWLAHNFPKINTAFEIAGEPDTDKEVQVLDTVYKITVAEIDLDGVIAEVGADIDTVKKVIAVEGLDLQGYTAYQRKEAMHEGLVRAFLTETGMVQHEENDALVRWVTAMFPKMLVAFKEVGAI